MSDGFHQLREDAERKFGFGLGRPCGQGVESPESRPGDRLLQQRGLSVAGPAPKNDRPVSLGHRPEELVDRRELRVASDERRHVTEIVGPCGEKT